MAFPGGRQPLHEAGMYHSFATGKIPSCPFSRMSAGRGLDPIQVDKSRKRARGNLTVTEETSQESQQSSQVERPPGLYAWKNKSKHVGEHQTSSHGLFSATSGPHSTFPGGGKTQQEQLFYALHTTAIVQRQTRREAPPPISFWTISDGWEKRPRPKTSENYRALGRHTAAAGSRWVQPQRPTSSFVSATEKYTGLMLDGEFVDMKPKTDQSCLYSPGPKYNLRDPAAAAGDSSRRLRVDNRMFGKAPRFQKGRTFVPRTCGADRIYMPNEAQVRPNVKGCSSLLASRPVIGGIYEAGRYCTSPGPALDTNPASRCTSLRRFPSKSTTFGAPCYGAQVRQTLRSRGDGGEGGGGLQGLLERFQQGPGVAEDGTGLKSASAVSIVHGHLRGADDDQGRQGKGGKQAGWAAAYADCLSVSTYAGKIRAMSRGRPE